MITRKRLAFSRTNGTAKRASSNTRRGYGKARHMVEDLETFKSMMLGLREEALKELEILRSNLNEHSSTDEGDIEVDLKDRIYQASMSSADADSITRQSVLVAELNAALERIKVKDYGRCEECGAPIDKMRLMAMPHTRTCFACKKRSPF